MLHSTNNVTSVMIFPANLLTGTKHPALSTSHLTDTNSNYNQNQHKNVNMHARKILKRPRSNGHLHNYIKLKPGSGGFYAYRSQGCSGQSNRARSVSLWS